MALRIIIGLVLTVVAAAVAGRRLWWLYRLGRTGQPAPERIEALREHPAEGAETQVTQVIGQRKLLKWTVPGVAHALTFWGFIVLVLTIIEAYGALFSKHFAIVLIGTWAWVGFVEDLFAVAVLAGIVTFAVIRLTLRPQARGAQVALLRVAHRRRLAGAARHLPGRRDPADLPGRADQHRRLPLSARRVRVSARRPLAAPARRRE